MESPAAASPTPPRQSSNAKQDILSAFNTSQPISHPSTPSPAQPQQQAKATPPPPADPFASLVSGSRGGSPFPAAAQNQQPTQPSSSLLDLGGATPSPQPPNAPTAPPSKGPEDDEWDFASSLPQSSALPSTNKLQVLNSSLCIEFVARRHPTNPRQVNIVAHFSNATAQTINDLHFQVAVEKVTARPILVATNSNRDQTYTLQLRPQSGREVPPLQQNGVQQEMLLDGIEPGNGNSVKIRFKVSYKAGTEAKEEQGMVPPLGIS